MPNGARCAVILLVIYVCIVTCHVPIKGGYETYFLDVR